MNNEEITSILIGSETNLDTYEVTITNELKQKIYKQLLSEIRREIKIPGFRSANIPEYVIIDKYGSIVKEHLSKAITEKATAYINKELYREYSESRYYMLKVIDIDESMTKLKFHAYYVEMPQGFDISKLKLEAKQLVISANQIEENLRKNMDILAPYIKELKEDISNNRANTTLSVLKAKILLDKMFTYFKPDYKEINDAWGGIKVILPANKDIDIVSIEEGYLEIVDKDEYTEQEVSYIVEVIENFFIKINTLNQARKKLQLYIEDTALNTLNSNGFIVPDKVKDYIYQEVTQGDTEDSSIELDKVSYRTTLQLPIDYMSDLDNQSLKKEYIIKQSSLPILSNYIARNNIITPISEEEFNIMHSINTNRNNKGVDSTDETFIQLVFYKFKLEILLLLLDQDYIKTEDKLGETVVNSIKSILPYFSLKNSNADTKEMEIES